MMTVNAVSKLTGVSIRALQYYDKIGLLNPTGHTEAGYRLYDDAAMEKLQQILLFRELEFPLRDIERIISSPDFDRNKALEQQIELLTFKKEHLEDLIKFAKGMKEKGVKIMDFKAFDTSEMDEYARKAKEQWGKTAEYKEFEEKSKNRTQEDEKNLADDFMKLFVTFGKMKNMDPASNQVQSQVKRLQEYITEHYYKCSNEILSSLGDMYACGGDFTANIDAAGGEGTAVFTDKAIKIFCKTKN